MQHKKKGNHLGRTTSHKKALMRTMAAQVIEHKEIRTTVAKAKELRLYVERLITYGKKGSLHHRRLAFKFLQNKFAVDALFEEIAPAFDTREGGYTRIIKLGKRKGDAASISLFQLVGFEKGGDAGKSKPKAEKKGKSEKKAKSEETVETVAENQDVQTEMPAKEKEEKPEVAEAQPAEVETAVEEKAKESESVADDQAASEEAEEDKTEKEK